MDLRCKFYKKIEKSKIFKKFLKKKSFLESWRLKRLIVVRLTKLKCLGEFLWCCVQNERWLTGDNVAVKVVPVEKIWKIMGRSKF